MKDKSIFNNMKNRISLLMIYVFVLLLLPVRASACGGFVAVRGEKIFHSVYCDDMKGSDLNKLRWFDTAKKAENSGLKMCEKCADFRDSDFDSEYCSMYFNSSDPLTITAMELSTEYGQEIGEENGFELARDEYYGQYDAGYDKGYSDAKEDAEKFYREKEEERKAENQLNDFQILCIMVVLFVSIAVVGDLASVSWAAFRGKDYKSLFGEFIEKSLSSGAIAPLVIGAMFVYGIISLI